MRFSKDVLALNPQLDDATRRQATRRQATQRHEDRADRLLAELRVHAPDLPLPVRDHPFQTFKIDLAWRDAGVAVEVNGGLKRPGGGKHATSRDHHKVRELTLAGWLVLIFTSSEVVHDPIGCIAAIRRALLVRTRTSSATEARDG